VLVELRQQKEAHFKNQIAVCSVKEKRSKNVDNTFADIVFDESSTITRSQQLLASSS